MCGVYDGNITRPIQSKSDKEHSAIETIALASICDVFKAFSCVKTSIKQLCELKLVRLPLEFLSLSRLYSDILFPISRNRKYSDSQKLSAAVYALRQIVTLDFTG